MLFKPLKEKISPTFATAKGRHPTWNSYDECRWHWRKRFKIRNIWKGKRIQQKRKNFTRISIKDLNL